MMLRAQKTALVLAAAVVALGCQRFIDRPSDDLATLNAWVYSTLFLTPASDPWLGLMPPSVYTGLPDDGLVPAR
jgi:hypothetical protein